MEDKVQITIINWEKYQGRKDIAHPHWFRLQNEMWRDQQFFKFDAAERWVWVCLLSYASQNNSRDIALEIAWFCAESGVSKKVFESSIDKLSRNGCVTSAYGNVARHNITEQNITKDRSSKPSRPSDSESVFDFEMIYSKYPRKLGRKVGLDLLLRTIKSKLDYENFHRAVVHYAAATQRTEKTYIMHFSTFCAKERWKDYINPPEDLVTKQKPSILLD